MSSLPRPPEPDLKTLESYAKQYESGIQDYFEDNKPVKDEILAKRGMIRYLWSEWEPYDISYRDVQKAVGNIGSTIELWYDHERSWEVLLERLEEQLDNSIRK